MWKESIRLKLSEEGKRERSTFIFSAVFIQLQPGIHMRVSISVVAQSKYAK